jgi:hypothetical protein
MITDQLYNKSVIQLEVSNGEGRVEIGPSESLPIIKHFY